MNNINVYLLDAHERPEVNNEASKCKGLFNSDSIFTRTIPTTMSLKFQKS